MTPADLPRYCLVTPEPDSGAPAAAQRAFVDTLAAVLEGGPLLVQLRAKTLAPDEFATLAADVIACCHAHDTCVILNGALAPAAALALGADGIHLGSAALHAATVRPVPANALLSVACHSLEDLQRAESIGADCVTLSPVLPTLSHPEAAALGWDRFAAWATQASMPVYALGGMTRAHLDHARAHGAHGIAAIRGLWETAPDAQA